MRNRLFALLLLTSLWVFAQPTSFPPRDDVYYDASVPRIDISIRQSSLDSLMLYVTSDVEFDVDFVFTGNGIVDSMSRVGFRLRGNTSRYAQKKSYKVAFNSFTGGQRWQGVKKLNLNGEHNDPSMSRARLSWGILENIGLPAARVNHVRLYINGVYKGLYANTEHINDDYVEKRFDGKAGNLYKCLWPATLSYRGSTGNDYKHMDNGRRVYELKTNEDDDDYSGLAHFIDVLNNTTLANLPCELESVFNVNSYLMHLAFEMTIGHWDNHAFNQNNFYLYEDPESGLMQYLSFDLDNTLGVDWSAIDWSTRNIHSWGNSNYPLYQRLMAIPEYQLRLQVMMAQIIHPSIDNNVWYGSSIAMKNQLLPFVANDPAYPLDYSYNINYFQNSWNQAAGAHVTKGIHPFLGARINASNSQFISGNAAPLLYPGRLSGNSNLGPINVGLMVLDESSLSWVKLHYRYDSIGPFSSLLLHDNGMSMDGLAGDKYFGGQLTAPGDSVHLLDYYFSAKDNNNQISQWPCSPISRPLATAPALLVNEVMSDNDGYLIAADGSDPDWIEIYNPSPVSVNLSNFFLSDKLNQPHKGPLGNLVIPAHGHALFYANDGDTNLSQSLDFTIKSKGEPIYLFFQDSNQVDYLVDQLHAPPMTSNQTYGRKWDAFPQWTIFGDHGSANSVNSGPLTLTDTPPTLGLKAYPNPNTGQFTLSNQSEWDCRVQVWNLNGQLLQTIAINSQEDLSIVSEEYPSICLLIWLDLNGHVIKHEQLIHIKSS